ncbi:MAG: hypothetical protein HW382_725 [Deltaproteobacteria bacterium]|nr:hypothetical protein [Deltaproteobacteria bacterium]
MREIAVEEHVDFLTRNPHINKAYSNSLVAICLCQGAASHYINPKIGVKDFDPALFENRLSENFKIERMPAPSSADLWSSFMKRLKEKGKRAHSFGVYAEGWNHAAIMTLRNEEVMDKFVAEHSKAYRRLDVTILHTLVIENILGVSKERQERKENIEYIQDEGEGLSKVQNGERQIFFILNPTKVTEVEEVAKARDKMPQKSTYFYPKLLTGLVINKIGDTTI